MRKFVFFLIFYITFLNAEAVIDYNSDEIEIQDRVKKVILASAHPISSIFVVFDETAKHLTPMPGASIFAEKYSLLERLFPYVANISTKYDSDRNSFNVEEILELQPDVIFYYADNKINKGQLTNANISNVGFNSSLKVFEEWIKLMSELTDQDGRAEKIIDFAYKREAKIPGKTKNSKKHPVALIVMHHKDGKFNANDKNHYFKYWLDTTGAIKDVNEMNLEEFYKINPDIIHTVNFNPSMLEDFNKPINGVDFTKAKSVKNEKVYKFSLGMYKWRAPLSDDRAVVNVA